MAAQGVLRILIVFASFPDDETLHPMWPAHQPPLFMEQFLDRDTVTHSAVPFNITNYFRVMSLGKLQIVGDVLWVESSHSQEEYRNGSYGRANTDIITGRVDSLVDFSQYDSWTLVADHNIINLPDGIVDMIVMVWRTSMFAYLGEASLGYKPAISADGKTIAMGFPENYAMPEGSGVTCEYPYTDSPQGVMKTMAHELGHWLLGGGHPYSTQLAGKYQYWGMLCDGQRISSCANSYERETLGWITVPSIDADKDISLTDYVTTGAALKYHPVNGDDQEYFYVENHQEFSVFDDVTRNPIDRGVWILHQQGPYLDLDNLCIRPSDGNWNWESAQTSQVCFDQPLPVFHKAAPGVLHGQSHRDQIPTPESAVNWLYAFHGDTGGVQCGAFLGGEAFSGAFDTATAAVFSPTSNPSSATWGRQQTTFALEVVRVTDGVAVVRSYSNPLDAAPARRYLGMDTSAHGVPTGRLPLAWGAQWTDGQPLEPDVVGSTLERRVGDGIWEVVYEGSTTRWIDSSRDYATSGSVPVAFRAKVLDSKGKSSLWSNVLSVYAMPVAGVSTTRDHAGSSGALAECYPNPFNAVVTVQITISPAMKGHVRVAVLDLLGREAAVLMDGYREPGVYRTRFDGRNFASGVFIVSVMAGGRFETTRILLLR